MVWIIYLIGGASHVRAMTRLTRQAQTEMVDKFNEIIEGYKYILWVGWEYLSHRAPKLLFLQITEYCTWPLSIHRKPYTNLWKLQNLFCVIPAISISFCFWYLMDCLVAAFYKTQISSSSCSYCSVHLFALLIAIHTSNKSHIQSNLFKRIQVGRPFHYALIGAIRLSGVRRFFIYFILKGL